MSINPQLYAAQQGFYQGGYGQGSPQYSPIQTGTLSPLFNVATPQLTPSPGAFNNTNVASPAISISSGSSASSGSSSRRRGVSFGLLNAQNFVAPPSGFNLSLVQKDKNYLSNLAQQHDPLVDYRQILTELNTFYQQNGSDYNLNDLIQYGNVKKIKKEFGVFFKDAGDDQNSHIFRYARKVSDANRKIKKAAVDPYQKGVAEYKQREADKAIRQAKREFAKATFGFDLYAPSASLYNPSDAPTLANIYSQYADEYTDRLSEMAGKGRKPSSKAMVRLNTLNADMTKPDRLFVRLPGKPREKRFTSNVGWTDPNADGYVDVNNTQLFDTMLGGNYATLRDYRVLGDDGKYKRLPAQVVRYAEPYIGKEDGDYILHYSNAQLKKAFREELSELIQDPGLAERIKIDPDVIFALREFNEQFMRKVIAAIVAAFINVESGTAKPKTKITLAHVYHLLKSQTGQQILTELNLSKLQDGFQIGDNIGQFLQTADPDFFMNALPADVEQEYMNRLPAVKKKGPPFASRLDQQQQIQYLRSHPIAQLESKFDTYDPQARQSLENLTVADYAINMGRKSYTNKKNKLQETINKKIKSLEKQGFSPQDIQNYINNVPEWNVLNVQTYDQAIQNGNLLYPDQNTIQQAYQGLEVLREQTRKKRSKLDLPEEYKHLAPLVKGLHLQTKMAAPQQFLYVSQAVSTALYGNEMVGQPLPDGDTLFAKFIQSGRINNQNMTALRNNAKGVVSQLLGTIFGAQELSRWSNTLTKLNIPAAVDNPELLLILFSMYLYQLSHQYSGFHAQMLDPNSPPLMKVLGRTLTQIDSVDVISKPQMIGDYEVWEVIQQMVVEEFSHVQRVLNSSKDVDEKEKTLGYGHNVIQYPKVIKLILGLLMLDSSAGNALAQPKDGSAQGVFAQLDGALAQLLGVMFSGNTTVLPPNPPFELTKNAYVFVSNIKTSNVLHPLLQQKYQQKQRNYVLTKQAKQQKKATRQALAARISTIHKFQPAF